jgi:hypothetical protein
MSWHVPAHAITPISFMKQASTTLWNSWGLSIENNGNELFDAWVNGPGIVSADGLLADDGNWKYLTLVWDGDNSTATQYINGVETGTGPSWMKRISFGRAESKFKCFKAKSVSK